MTSDQFMTTGLIVVTVWYVAFIWALIHAVRDFNSESE